MNKRMNVGRFQSGDSRHGNGIHQGKQEDGPMQPVNYSGTQVNIFGSPSPEYIAGVMQQCRGSGVDPAYPYGMMYPATGFTNQVQMGFLTEHMLRKLDESRLLAMSELLPSRSEKYSMPVQASPSQGRAGETRRSSPSQGRVGETRTSSSQGRLGETRRALEYDGESTRISPGNGDWRGQLKYIYSRLIDIANEDKEFRVSLAEPRFAEIISADLEEDDDGYFLTVKFAKHDDGEEKKLTSPGPARSKPPTSTDQRMHRAASESGRYVSPASAKGQVDQQSGEARRQSSTRSTTVKKGNESEENRYEKENIQQEGTLKAFKQFNAENDAKTLRNAMKGIGTDEDAITSILGKRTAAQRQEIIKMYKTLYGKDMIKDLKGELSGDYWEVIQALCQPQADYDARELRKALKGLGTDDDAVIEIICTRTNKTLKAVQESYKRLFNRTLEDDIAGDTSGHYGRLLVAQLQANRDESNVVDLDLAKKEAQELLEAGVSKWGTDESVFNAIMVTRSPVQLKATFKEYEALAGKSIEEAIQSEMSGDLAKGMLTLVQCIKGKPTYFAQKLYNAIKGLGTDDDAIIRIIVTRCELDMVQIKDEFQRLFKQSLAQFVADDTSGDYRKILLTLLGESNTAKNS